MGVEACTCDECKVKNAVAERDAARKDFEMLRGVVGGRVQGAAQTPNLTALADLLAAELDAWAESRAVGAATIARIQISRDTLIVLAQRLALSWEREDSAHILAWSEETGGPMIEKALGIEVS